MKAGHIIIILIVAVLIVLGIAFYRLLPGTTTVKEYTMPEVVDMIWPQPESITATTNMGKKLETIAQYDITITVGSDLARTVDGQPYAFPQVKVNHMKPFLMQPVPMDQSFAKYTRKSGGFLGSSNRSMSSSSGWIFHLQTLLEKTDGHSPAKRLYRFNGAGIDEKSDSLQELKETAKNKLQEFYESHIEKAQQETH